MNKPLRQSIIKGISWSAFERLSVQGTQFIVFVLMARVLIPTDYGLVSMLSLFIIISQLIAEGGLSQAIIRKLDSSEEVYSTAFFVNVAIGLGLYLTLFMIAPLISTFYDEQLLTPLLRILGLCVIIQSTLVVHRAILTSRLDFKTQAKSTLVGALFSGIIGLYMAYNGCGVWSLVGLQLSNQIATALVLWIVSDWRPKRKFSRRAFRELFGFGSKLLISNVLESLYQFFYTLIIGKVFSAYALGCYSNARQLGSFSSENISRIIQRATFPMFCTYQNDITYLRKAVNDYLIMATFFIAPLMLGLAAIAEPLTFALIGEQWLYTARLLRILCFSFLFYPLSSINFMILEVNGRGSTYLKLMSLNILFGIIMLVSMLSFGLSAICCGLCVASIINFVLCAVVAGGSIGFGLRAQVKIIIPILLISTIMGIVVYLISTLVEGDVLRVIIGIIVGIICYIGLSVVFTTTTCKRVLNTIRKNRPQ